MADSCCSYQMITAGWWDFPVKFRDPQSGDLINVSFPAALVTSEEKTPTRIAQICGSALLCEGHDHDDGKETCMGKQKRPLALEMHLAPHLEYPTGSSLKCILKRKKLKRARAISGKVRAKDLSARFLQYQTNRASCKDAPRGLCLLRSMACC